MNLLLTGLFVVIIAGIFQGSFAVPMAYTRRWKWENTWMLYVILSMIVFNLLFAAVTVPNLWGIYTSSPAIMITPLIFGVLIGFAAIAYGLGLVSVGLSLGLPIMQGLVTGAGTFIPMVILYPGEIFTAKGVLILLTLVISIVGVGIIGVAGIRREREQGGTAGKISKISNIPMRVGIIFCILNGVLASAFNLGFTFSGKLIAAAIQEGASPFWAGNAVWGVLFTVGGIMNVLYCLMLMKKNHTAGVYAHPGFLRNFLLIVLMAVVWIASFIMYGSGATMMGSWGTIIGWPIYMILSIAAGTVWGVVQGEWSGEVSVTTKRIMVLGLGLLLVSIILLGYSATLTA